MEFYGNEGHNNIERARFYLWEFFTTTMGHQPPHPAQNGESPACAIASAVSEQTVLRRRRDGKSHLGDLSRVIIETRPPAGGDKRTARLVCGEAG
jgi:hypothetical protein